MQSISEHTSTKQIISLTSLRGVAAWVVVLFHFKAYLYPYFNTIIFSLINNGELGVDLFFILSGFILYYTYYNSLNSSNYLFFITKRIARIYPLHLFMLFLYLSIPLAIFLFSNEYTIYKTLGGRYQFSLFISHFFLVNAWSPNFELSWNTPSWSISAEWFCYLLFPLFLKFTTMIKNYITILFLFFLLITIFQTIANMNNMYIGEFLSGFGLIRAFTEFYAGCFIYKIHQNKITLPILIICNILSWLLQLTLNIQMECFIVISAFSALIIYLKKDNLFSRILSLRILEFNGKISYSIYLCHYYIYDIFKFIAVKDQTIPVNPLYIIGAFVSVFIFSCLLYKFIEVPARNYINGYSNTYFKGQASSLSCLLSILRRRKEI